MAVNRQETLSVLAVLKAAYPQFYRGMTKVDADGVVALWTGMFADDSLQVVEAAVKALIACDTKGYPPHIGAVKEYIQKLTQPAMLTEAEAWGIVLKAVRRSGYNSKEEFEKLPPDLQRIVGNPNQLREWAMMDSDPLQSVVASNFQRSYRARANEVREYTALPAEVRSMVAGVAAKFALPANEEVGT